MFQQKNQVGSDTQQVLFGKYVLPDSNLEALLYIIGKNTLQNELLMSYLKEQTGLKTECLSCFDSECFCDEDKPYLKKFVLIDFEGVETRDLWTDIDSLINSHPSQFFLAFYNVKPNAQIEKKAMVSGIKGIFYDRDSLEILPKGICSILDGDLWYSRKALTKCLLDSMTSTKDKNKMNGDELLTQREKEILELIAIGNNSRKISDELCISIHTVKTHIYNVYNKINVNNRLQATLWAAKYL